MVDLPEIPTPDLGAVTEALTPDLGGVTDALTPDVSGVADALTPEISVPEDFVPEFSGDALTGNFETPALSGNFDLPEAGGVETNLEFTSPDSPLESASFSAPSPETGLAGVEGQLQAKPVELGENSSLQLEAGVGGQAPEASAKFATTQGRLGADFEYDTNQQFSGSLGYSPAVGPVNRLSASMQETDFATAQSGFAPIDVAATAKPISLGDDGQTLNLGAGGTFAGLNPNEVKANANLDFANGASVNGQYVQSLNTESSYGKVSANYVGESGGRASISQDTLNRTEIAASVPIERGEVYGSATLRDGELDKVLAGIKKDFGDKGIVYAEGYGSPQIGNFGVQGGYSRNF